MRLQLHLEAQHLANIAGLFKGYSDPYAKVQLLSTEKPFKTEYIKNCLDPKWVTPIYLDCDVDSEELDVLVEIFDHSGDHSGKQKRIYDPDQDEYMAKKKFDLKPLIDQALMNQVEGYADAEETFKFDDGDGSLKVHVALTEKTDERMEFQFRGIGIRNVEKGIFGLGRSDPYFEIAKKYHRPMKGKPHVQPVFRSEVKKNHLNPLWNRAIIDLEHLCDNNMDMTLVITVYDGPEEKTFLSQTFTRVPIGFVEIKCSDVANNVTNEEEKKGNGDTTNALQLKRKDSDNFHVGNLVILQWENI